MTAFCAPDCRIALVFVWLAAATWPVRAEIWTVDHQRSRLGFELVETRNPVVGRFERWTADISYDPANLAAARIRVEVDTASAVTGDARRDPLMIGSDWLDSARVPTAVFEAQGFRSLGGDRFEASGPLKMRDGERPVTLTFTLTVKDEEARARGRATLVRTQFGIGHGQWSGAVSFDVAVAFDIVARRRR
ncbi:MAG: YceI family protein [Hyphomicrobiaceae bacterium]|jgi:polyisoprenoid-binding protein YceI